MRFRIPLVTRREFIKKTTSAGAVASIGGAVFSPTLLQTTSTMVGKKGQTYPDQRRKYTDSKSSRTVWQLTNHAPGRGGSYSYYNVPHFTPDMRWALYSSDRASATPKKLNLFKMDLRTGESVQLTESSDILSKDSVVMSADGKEVYFFDEGNSLRVVNMESLQERKICQLAENVQRPRHNSSLTSDKRFLLTPRRLEKPVKYGYSYPPWAERSALIVIRTDNGQMHHLVDGMYPVGIAEHCPGNDNLILWDIHGDWEAVQRPWVIRADGTGNHAVLMTIKGESSGHQYWGQSTQSVYSVLCGGRYPQGLWACNADGSNERCVMAGPTIAHAQTSPAEDRHVADEVYGQTNAMFLSRKGSTQAEVLCQIPDWFETREGTRETRPYHPHARFTPNGNGVTFSNEGNLFLVEL